MSRYNIEAGIRISLPNNALSTFYRGQDYAPGDYEGNTDRSVAWSPVNFSYSPLKNRFTPENVKTTYFACSIATTFVETTEKFRHSIIKNRRTIKFSADGLRKREMITFTLPQTLELFELSDELAAARHGIKRDDAIICSVDLTPSKHFASLVYQAGYDGIIYPTRQGINQAVVVFESAKDKFVLEDKHIVKRQSYYSALMTLPTIEKDLDIKIIEDKPL